MYSTMHSFPLTITAILRHATRVHGARKVYTATGDGYRECTYAELGQRTAQLANA
jgi:fatty-acyl-CoA synthase